MRMWRANCTLKGDQVWTGRERKGKSLHAFGIIFWVNRDTISLSVFFSWSINYFSEVAFYHGERPLYLTMSRGGREIAEATHCPARVNLILDSAVTRLCSSVAPLACREMYAMGPWKDPSRVRGDSCLTSTSRVPAMH